MFEERRNRELNQWDTRGAQLTAPNTIAAEASDMHVELCGIKGSRDDGKLPPLPPRSRARTINRMGLGLRLSVALLNRYLPLRQLQELSYFALYDWHAGHYRDEAKAACRILATSRVKPGSIRKSNGSIAAAEHAVTSRGQRRFRK